jgi:hypothetical protein
MKIGGMGEQAIRVQFWNLRRIHELPEEVQVLAVLPDLPQRPRTMTVDHAGQPGYGGNVLEYCWDEYLPADWIPHRRPSTFNARCLYVHVQHRYCFRGTEQGAPLIIEDLDDFLKRFRQIAEDEVSKRGQPVPENVHGVWVNDDA